MDPSTIAAPSTEQTPRRWSAALDPIIRWRAIGGVRPAAADPRRVSVGGASSVESSNASRMLRRTSRLGMGGGGLDHEPHPAPSQDAEVGIRQLGDLGIPEPGPTSGGAIETGHDGYEIDCMTCFDTSFYEPYEYRY